MSHGRGKGSGPASWRSSGGARKERPEPIFHPIRRGVPLKRDPQDFRTRLRNPLAVTDHRCRDAGKIDQVRSSASVPPSLAWANPRACRLTAIRSPNGSATCNNWPSVMVTAARSDGESAENSGKEPAISVGATRDPLTGISRQCRSKSRIRPAANSPSTSPARSACTPYRLDCSPPPRGNSPGLDPVVR